MIDGGMGPRAERLIARPCEALWRNSDKMQLAISGRSSILQVACKSFTYVHTRARNAHHRHIPHNLTVTFLHFSDSSRRTR